MNQAFKNIGILGGGLLGGSIALALNGKVGTRLWFRKPANAAFALELGLKNATTDLPSAVADVDLLILAVPVGAMPGLLAAAIHAGLPPTCLVTDVGSVKRTPHETLTPFLEKSGNPFIGSHPMAGSEQTGLAAARADLFENAACLLTNDSHAPEALVEKLADFWRNLGCRTTLFTAAEHDALVARISHLPHITAASTALSALRNGSESGHLSGGGLRDTTRVASGNPDMWAEILIENRHAIMPELKDTITRLHEILAALENANQEQTRRWLEGAKALRDTLNRPN